MFTVRQRCGTLALLALASPLMAQTAPPAPPAKPTPTAAPTPAAQAPAGSVGGVGDVNLYPKRVVINDRQRIATVGLFNRAAVAGDYEISLNDQMMTPEGKLVELSTVTDPVARARVKVASELLRWSPHRVTLQGNEAQTVRIIARITPDLAPGEYRSHFTALAVPSDSVGGLSIENAAGASKPGQIGVRIVPRFGISIPVILRVGETTLTTGLTGLKVLNLPGGRKVVSVIITRQGTRSAFGDVSVTAPGAKKPVAEVRGVGVYTEVDQRAVQLPIDPLTEARFTVPGAKLTVTYTDDDVAPGKALARQDFTVP